MSKSGKSNSRRTSKSSWILGIWRLTFGFENVCTSAWRQRARNRVIRVLRSLSWLALSGYVIFLSRNKARRPIDVASTQHGIAGGYYLTFLMGGFITSAARLARQNFRPFTQHSSKPIQQIYDILGIFTTIIVLNYAAAPFMILSARDSIHAWIVLGWYGHIIVMGGLAFFYFGGTKYLKDLQKKKGILPPSKGSAKVTTNGTATPTEAKNFVLPPAVDTIVPVPEI